MIRALKEFRIRGVKQNIPLLINIIGHPKFQAGDVNTSFLELNTKKYLTLNNQEIELQNYLNTLLIQRLIIRIIL